MKSLPAILIAAFMVASVGAANEPEFDFAYSDGLYATITVTKRIEKPRIVGEEIITLFVPGFQKEMKVRVLWQRDANGRIREAPLAVPLLGMAGNNKDELSRLWQSLLFDTGCHVMAADSTFSYDFNKISGHGVSGNIAAEAEAEAKVIEAFLQTPAALNKVTDVRLLGASYGGNVALYVAKMGQEGKLSFPLGAVMALSPPVSLRSSAQILDDFYEQDFGSYGYDPNKLIKLKKTGVVTPDSPAPFDPRLMRAGIGYVFRSALTPVVKTNDKMYGIGLMEQYKRIGDPRGSAKGWSFTEFVEEMSYPYWRDRGTAQSITEFWAMGDIQNVLTNACDNVRVYVSKDDPLNLYADVAALEDDFDPPLFNVLPGGGHLGFAESEWVKQTVMNTFGPQTTDSVSIGRSRPAPGAATCRR